MPRDVFISFSHEDQAIADQVVASLEAADMSCWISSRDEMPGDNWPEKISRALDESKIVVFILSAKSNASEDCKNELALARDKKKPIIPMRIEDIPPAPDVRYFIARAQRLDAITRPIDKYLTDLVNTSRTFLQSILGEETLTEDKIESISEAVDDTKDFGAEEQKTDSGLVKVWMDKAADADGLGLYQKAIQCYDKALAINQYDATILNAKALRLMKIGSYQEAVECCERATQIQPGFAKAWKNRGICLQKLNQPDKALECYDKAVDVDPLDAEAEGLKGSAYIDLGQNKEAFEGYDAASKIDSSNAEYWYGKGLCLSKLGRMDEALRSLDRVLDIEPQHWEALYAKGTSLAALGRDEEAIKAFDEGLTIDPGCSKAWYQRGKSLARLSLNQEAIESYDKAIEIDENLVDAWYKKGVSLTKLLQPQDAADCFAKALKFDPKNSDARQQKAVVDKQLRIAEQLDEGMELAAQGEHKEAIKVYNKVGRSDPQNAEIWYRKGISWLELQKINKAEQSFNKALELDPQHVGANEAIATIQNKRGQTEEVGSQTLVDVSAAEGQSRTSKADEKPIGSKPDQKDVAQVPMATDGPAIEEYSLTLESPRLQQTVSREVRRWLSNADQCFHQGKYSQAILWYDKVLDEEPDYAVALVHKGDALAKLGRRHEASQCFYKAKAITKDPQLVQAVNVQAAELENVKIRELSSKLADTKRELAREEIIAEARTGIDTSYQHESLQKLIKTSNHINWEGRLRLTTRAVIYCSEDRFMQKGKDPCGTIIIPLDKISKISTRRVALGIIKMLVIEFENGLSELPGLNRIDFSFRESRSLFIKTVKQQQIKHKELQNRIQSLEAHLQTLQQEMSKNDLQD